MEEDLANMGECLVRKANLDDLQYFSKELSIKLDKGELDVFRQEFVDRITSFDQKLFERNQILQRFGEELEAKLDTNILQHRQAL